MDSAPASTRSPNPSATLNPDSLLQLAAETRTTIYEYLFAGSEITIEYPPGRHNAERYPIRNIVVNMKWRDTRPIAILTVCKTLYKEAQDILVKNTRLVVPYHFSIYDLPLSFRNIYLPRIEHVGVLGWKADLRTHHNPVYGTSIALSKIKLEGDMFKSLKRVELLMGCFDFVSTDTDPEAILIAAEGQCIQMVLRDAWFRFQHEEMLGDTDMTWVRRVDGGQLQPDCKIWVSIILIHSFPNMLSVARCFKLDSISASGST